LLNYKRTLSSKEAQYKLLGKFPHACKFRYPLGTYQGNSHSHALVARPNKRRVTIPNGGYQAYHAQRHDNLQVVYKYASEWGLKAQRKALFKGFFPHWYNIEKPDTHYPMPLRRFRELNQFKFFFQFSIFVFNSYGFLPKL